MKSNQPTNAELLNRWNRLLPGAQNLLIRWYALDPSAPDFVENLRAALNHHI